MPHRRYGVIASEAKQSRVAPLMLLMDRRGGSFPVSGLPPRFAANSHGNPETKGHEKIQSTRAVYISQMPLRARYEHGRHLRDTARGRLAMTLGNNEG
jgi:hypothetical protein